MQPFDHIYVNKFNQFAALQVLMNNFKDGIYVNIVFDNTQMNPLEQTEFITKYYRERDLWEIN